MAGIALKINLSAREIVIWDPPEEITISEWAEQKRVLSGHAEEKGPIRLRRTPYLQPIMDSVLEEGIEQIVFCKPAQIAGTEFALSVAGYFADQFSAPIMFVLADEQTATYMSEKRLQTMFTDSPKLSHLSDGKSTKFNQGAIELSNGAYIAMGWASSVARLASRPFRVVILDEIDKPGYSTKTKEASSISLAIERTETFFNRKIIMLSTPTVDSGNIWQQLLSCDVIYDWHVPCPYCGLYQPLRFSEDYSTGFSNRKFLGVDGEMHNLGGVVWDGGGKASPEQIEEAGYSCGGCGAIWTNTEKNIAVERGIHVSRKPYDETPRKIGFHINRLYSLLGRSGHLGKIVDDFLRAKNDRRSLQGFVNSTLAEPWIEWVGQDRGTESIIALKDDRPAGLVPEWAMILILTADVQETGVWYELRAWGLIDDQKTSALVSYGFLMRGDNVGGMAGDLHSLHLLSQKIFKTASGGEFNIHLSVCDSGYRTGEVYDLCRLTPGMYPAKGQPNIKGAPYRATKIDTYPGTSKLIPGGVLLISYSADFWKDELSTRLQINKENPGAWILHGEINEDYLTHYTAEIKDEEKLAWVQKGNQANHLWDCGVLQLIAADIEWKKGTFCQIKKSEQQKMVPGPRQQTMMPPQQRPRMW
jgi:phage terminase large subunit GpA-like protein